VTYLVDANVLSDPTRPTPSFPVVSWLRRHERELVVDPFVLGEIRFGIDLLPKRARRARLEQWFEDGVARIHCVTWDSSTGRRWARLLADLRRSGRAMPIKDSLIAATALTHDLTVATRNLADFAHAKVRLIDPWATAGEG
jgi:toxin FitB